MTVVLSVALGLVLASTVLSALDGTFALFLGSYALTLLDGILLFLGLLAMALVYGLMALTPAIPKRIFMLLALVLVGPGLIALPAAIFCYQRLQWIDWVASCGQVAAAVLILRWARGTWKPRWPLVAEKHLGARGFSWPNLLLFVALNIFVLAPVVAGYVAGCASLAVSHFTNGFVALRPVGVVMQARKYVRNDGRTVVLFPMSHIAESDFYRSVAQSVSSNSVVLLEGVTDNNHLLTNHITYKKAAKALHLSEQHEDFTITQGTLVRADVDVKEFSTNTIAILNLVTLVHSEGVNADTMSQLLQFAPSEDIQQQLFDDLLRKRNQHVLKELFDRLPEADDFIIPWGAAHMAGISREIEKAGFRLVSTRDFVSIRFGGKPGAASGNAGWVPQGTGAN